MKKIVLSIVGSMLIGVCAVNAQQTDTEGTADRTKDRQQNSQSEQTQDGDRAQMQRDRWQQQSDRSQNQNDYANEGMVMIDKNEIPSTLKQTLQQDKYAGWENATIYHNTNTGEYVIAPRAYRFDRNGNEIEMPDAAGYGSRDGRSSRYSPGQATDRAGQSRTADQQARDQMSEIPTSASKEEQGNSSDQSSSRETTLDQSQPQQQSASDRSGQQDNAARQPSAGYRSGQTDAGAGTQTQPGQSGREQYSTEGMTEVQAEQIPASLRRTLRGSQYSGWQENGTLYQDPSTNEYVLVMDKNGNATTPRTYRFDKNGRAKEGTDDGAAQSRQEQ